MFWIFVRIASKTYVAWSFNAIFLYNFSLNAKIERRFRDIQIVIITNFVVVSSVGIKRVICTTDKPLYTNTRYNDKIRYNENLTVTKASLKW